jgi:hypothetical protein
MVIAADANATTAEITAIVNSTGISFPKLLPACQAYSKLRYQRRASAVVCGHLLKENAWTAGFVENSCDPDDLQAWRDACEEMFLREGEMTETFREFCQIAIVCVICYAEIKQRHSHPIH